MPTAPAANWPPAGRFRDERLAFFAAEPILRRRAMPWWLSFLRVLNNTRGGGRAAGANRDVKAVAKGRMGAYALACDAAAARLDPDERALLRATGALPDWFIPAVEAERRELRRS